MKTPLLIFLGIFLSSHVFSQAEYFDDSKVLWYKEAYGGVVIHSSSWGINARLGKHKTGRIKRFYEFDLTGIRNAKEYRQETSYEASKRYTLGKINSLYVVRTGIGIQRIITHKPVWGGVELRLVSLLGISWGFTKPVYLYIINDSSAMQNRRLLVKYDPTEHNKHNVKIYGKGPYFKGFDELSFYPGLYFKTGLNFEYGVTDQSISAIETGIIVDAFSKAVPIMAYEYNSNYFISLYISINFGGRYN